MLLVTAVDDGFDAPTWARFVISRRITKVVIVLTKMDGGKTNQNDTPSEELESYKRMISTIEGMYLPYITLKINPVVPQNEVLIFLAKYLLGEGKVVVDVSRGEPFLKIVLYRLTSVFPELVEVLYLLGSGGTPHERQEVFTAELDPDQRRKNTAKDLLAAFLNLEEPLSFREQVRQKALTSTNVEEMTGLSSVNVSKWLKQLSTSVGPTPAYLSAERSGENRRKLVYTLTDFGLMSLVMCYFRRIYGCESSTQNKQLDNTNEMWFKDVKKAVEWMTFSSLLKVESR